MNILFVTAEAVPFAKTGGLADVVGSLPQSLRAAGVNARVIMPLYAVIDQSRYQIEPLFSFPFHRPTGTTDVHVYHTEHQGVPFYFIQGWPYFGLEAQVYDGWGLDVPRFIFFNQVVMAAMWELKQREGWFPDIFHTHDWHTGLLPFLLQQSRNQPGWEKARSIMTIHNLAYQGNNAGGWLWEQGIPARTQPDLVYQNHTDNLLGIGLAYADGISTVSPRYAVEIQYPDMGYGLDGLIGARKDKLYGILNGIDVQQWDPATDPYITQNYDAETFITQRPPNKAQLQAQTGLSVDPDIPLIGIVSRLDSQKGIDVAIPALRELLQQDKVQFVALGSGDPQLAHALTQLAQDFPHQVRVHITFDIALAQRIYAGCDLFLMPSNYEPCGIGQMMAMRYGALPLVRETGGLADTVHNYDNADGASGTGFVYQWNTSNALFHTLRWAIASYREKPAAWQRMQARAMRTDFSWAKSAHEYIRLYQSLHG